jgi:hypothetical protein
MDVWMDLPGWGCRVPLLCLVLSTSFMEFVRGSMSA